MKKMEEIVEVLEMEAGTPYAKKVRCRLCGDIIFDVKDGCPQGDLNAAMKGLVAHLAIQHQITVDYHECSDPNCLD